MIRRVPEIFLGLCIDRIAGAFFQALVLLCVSGGSFISPPLVPPFFPFSLLMDEGFEVLTAAGICVGKRGHIQRIIKRKNQLALKPKIRLKNERVGETAGRRQEICVCVYI